ncbi:hypothetical protein LB557_25370 [Mesorhizobium sp. BR115XR7A]|uniref:class I SAM-dependent methyltransferase n=1 Tax=Mesorhizobium sp. BR115XR7A TaxID=2876645 RepID=UPI001CCC9EA1|nr:hypothetical protein [Mesorhizobium sp. BR115XR7A]MBZ9909343.1 hypothetical protein [Mesorhizobium sp. BR115XR7A]MBZ9932623.1 hypothetical protein [Mesorhizobium sp. BR1-1-5]
MQSSFEYARPLDVNSVDECIFYHSYDLPESGYVRGHWDLRGRFDDYINGESLDGKRVLDVGTASGFLSFEAEKGGAEVVSFDAESAAVWDRIPFPKHNAAEERRIWVAGANDYLTKWKRSCWLAHREFRSKNKIAYGNVYDIPAELGMFDTVIVGQILVHLRDMLGALSSIARRCSKTMIIAEGMIDNDAPISTFLGRADNPSDDFSFWHHSTGLYIELMQIMGFRLRSKTVGAFTCNVMGLTPRDIDITTLIFDRR